MGLKTIITNSGGGSSAFSALTSSTNTMAAMVVGTGASLSASGSGTITATVANALKSATTIVNVSAATAPTNGQILTATSGTTATWQTVTGTGSVTSVSVVSANGLAGTVATATTTPAITLSTSITGVLKGDGTAISAATSGTDYSAGTSALTTGIVKSTTTTGALTIAVAGDFPTLNQNTTGSAATLTTPRAINGVNFDGSAPITVAAAAGTLTGTTLASNVATSSITTLGSGASLPGNPTTTTQASTDNSTKIATTAYVTTGISNAISGINPAIAVSAATTAAGNTSAWTYNNGVSGVGATFTGPVNTAITIDGILFNTITTQSLLIKNDTQSPSGAFNGIYTFTTAQTAGTGAIFTRRLDYDTPSDINNTGAIPVVGGTANALTSWLITSTVNTVGTDPLTYTQFSINPTTVLTTSSTSSALTSFGSSPTFVTPVLGTPTSGTLTNCTIPFSGVTGGSAHAAVVLNSSGVPAYIAPGSNGNVLTSNGTDWTSAAAGSGALTLLHTITASTSATVIFSNTFVTSAYSRYKVIIDGVFSDQSGGTDLVMQLSSSGTYITTNYITSGTSVTSGNTQHNIGGSSKTYAALTSGGYIFNAATAAHQDAGFVIDILGITQTTANPVIISTSFINAQGSGAGNFICSQIGSGIEASVGTIDAIKCFMVTGNIVSGTFSLYGVTE